MPVINFPPDPNVGQSYIPSNGINYVWDGEKWNSLSSTVGPISTIAGISINIDGGNSNSNYTIDQIIDGGGA
jgi:hypothetical protein